MPNQNHIISEGITNGIAQKNHQEIGNVSKRVADENFKIIIELIFKQITEGDLKQITEGFFLWLDLKSRAFVSANKKNDFALLK